MKKVMEKVKGLLRTVEVKTASVATIAAVAMTGAASAADESAGASTTITTAFQTGFHDMASQALSMIAVIVPIALGVAGTVWLVRKAMGWFKSMTH